MAGGVGSFGGGSGGGMAFTPPPGTARGSGTSPSLLFQPSTPLSLQPANSSNAAFQAQNAARADAAQAQFTANQARLSTGGGTGGGMAFIPPPPGTARGSGTSPSLLSQPSTPLSLQPADSSNAANAAFQAQNLARADAAQAQFDANQANLNARMDALAAPLITGPLLPPNFAENAGLELASVRRGGRAGQPPLTPGQLLRQDAYNRLVRERRELEPGYSELRAPNSVPTYEQIQQLRQENARLRSERIDPPAAPGPGEPLGPGWRVLAPAGQGAAIGPLPSGYQTVSRWVSPQEAAAWMAQRGTSIPMVSGSSGRMYVTEPGAARPGGTGPIRVDFAVPEAALQRAGRPDWFQIFQPSPSRPIYNVQIHVPEGTVIPGY